MYHRIKKAYRVGLISTLLVGGLFSVFAHGQSIPTVGSNVSVSTITQPRPEAQCLEPGGVVVNKTKHFYFGDTYTTNDLVPNRGAGYDTLLLNDSKVFIYNPSLFNFTSVIKRRSNGIPSNVSSAIAMNGTFVVNSTSSGQLVYNIHRTALDNQGSTNYNISYMDWPNLSNHTTTLTNKTFYNQAGWVVNGYECVNYIVHYCGDGTVDTAQSMSSLVGGINNSIAAEQCDPNDPNQVGWGNAGCSTTCTPVNTIVKPTCTLNATSNGNGSYDIAWNIVGTFNPTQIDLDHNSINQQSYSVNTNNGVWSNVIPNGYGSFSVSLAVGNSAASRPNVCTDTFTISAPQTICGDGNIDLPNSNGVYEECDNGALFGYGCDATCKLVTPTCTLLADANNQLDSYPVLFSGNKDVRADYILFDLGDNTVLTNNINLPYSYTYANTGNYSATMTVENSYSPIAPGVVRPTASCTKVLDVVPGCEIILSSGNILLGEASNVSWKVWPDVNMPMTMTLSPSPSGSTWPHALSSKIGNIFVGPNLTHTGVYTFSIFEQTINGHPFSCTGILNVGQPDLNIDKTLLSTGKLLPGDMVEYKIELKNNGSLPVADAYIEDLMPSSLTLVSHHLVGISLNTGHDWLDSNGNWNIEYTGLYLAPGQSIILNVTGQVKQNPNQNETINCAYTAGDYDCVMYLLSAEPYLLKTQKRVINNVSTNFTINNINVNTGDYITYKIDFGNVGGGDTNNVRVMDHMPLCVDYISASIYGVNGYSFGQSQDINGRYVIEYTGFDLLAGQTGYMLVTGQIMNTSMCSDYKNDSYLYFYNPNVVLDSSVVADRSVRSIVSLTKDSNIHVHNPGDNKEFIIKVENFGPNPISDIVLDDVWPNSSCIIYSGRAGVGFTKDPVSLKWLYNPTLLPGDATTISLYATIANNIACVMDDYENVVNLDYIEMGTHYQDQANYLFDVVTPPLANISLIKTVNKSRVVAGDEVEYVIMYKNVGNTTVNSYNLIDYWPTMIDFISAIPFPSSIVNNSTGKMLNWNISSPLIPGQTGEIVLKGIVK